MKVRIVSDGTSPGTHVLDEDGEPLRNVRMIEWRIDGTTGFAVALLEVVRVPVEIVATPVVVEDRSLFERL